jgi:P27 family predicted phage terminase small subunit
MGVRGPHPAPTALKVLHGTRPDRINHAEPQPREKKIDPPKGLSRGALAIWRELAPDMVAKGVIKSWDPQEFAILCDGVARHRHAAQMLDTEGEVVEYPVFNKNGDLTGHRPAKNHWFAVWKETADVVGRYGARFGLSPSDRAGLSIGEARSDEREALLG